jgi:hypothetical protein
MIATPDTAEPKYAPFYKWNDGAPIRVFLLQDDPRYTCTDITKVKLDAQIRRIRNTVPALRNLQGVELIKRLPQSKLDAPLVIGLETTNRKIPEAFQTLADQYTSRGQQHGLSHVTRFITYAHGYGLEKGKIRQAYSWTVSNEGSPIYDEKTCMEADWNLRDLQLLLGPGGYFGRTSRWLTNLPTAERSKAAASLDLLYLKSLYACPGSPATVDCIKKQMQENVGSVVVPPTE